MLALHYSQVQPQYIMFFKGVNDMIEEKIVSILIIIMGLFSIVKRKWITDTNIKDNLIFKPSDLEEHRNRLETIFTAIGIGMTVMGILSLFEII